MKVPPKLPPPYGRAERRAGELPKGALDLRSIARQARKLTTKIASNVSDYWTLGLTVTLNLYQPPAAALDEPVVAAPLRPASYLPVAFASAAWLLPLLGWLWGTTQAPESTLSGAASGIPVAIFLAAAFSITGLFCALASLYLAYPRQSRTYAVFAPLVSRFLAGAFIATAAAGLLLWWWP